MEIERELITGKEEEILLEYGEDILNSKSFQILKTYQHHFRSNTYAHCIAVTLKALRFAKKMHIKVDVKKLVRGCLLHDYYLYNHRSEERIPWHLTRHPKIAAENAQRDFNISLVEYDMIASHMWPITFLRFPICREGWILVYADKVVSIKERFQKVVNPPINH